MNIDTFFANDKHHSSAMMAETHKEPEHKEAALHQKKNHKKVPESEPVVKHAQKHKKKPVSHH